MYYCSKVFEEWIYAWRNIRILSAKSIRRMSGYGEIYILHEMRMKIYYSKYSKEYTRKDIECTRSGIYEIIKDL